MPCRQLERQFDPLDVDTSMAVLVGFGDERRPEQGRLARCVSHGEPTWAP